ncbi:MAG: DUF973 family protein [Candidatus Nezhaarchaeota archaeon]|nr:DUF973 family protein [Candidatus Nezhaarchaeota archaeon]
MESLLVAGMRKLKTGALLSIIASVLAVVALGLLVSALAMLANLLTDLQPGAIPGTLPQVPVGAVALLAALSLIGLAAVVLALVSFILWFMATGDLKRHSPRLGIGRVGMMLTLIGMVIMAVAAVVAMGAVMAVPAHGPTQPTIPAALVQVAAGVYVVAIASAVLMLIGGVLFGVMLTRLPEEPNVDAGFKTAGVLFIIGMALSAALMPIGLSIVGVIVLFAVDVLIYVYSRSSLERLLRPQAAAAQA